MCVHIHEKFPFYDFKVNWNVSTNFIKNSKYEFTRKSVGWQFHCSVRSTDMTNLTIVLCKLFANAPKKNQL